MLILRYEGEVACWPCCRGRCAAGAIHWTHPARATLPGFTARIYPGLSPFQVPRFGPKSLGWGSLHRPRETELRALDVPVWRGPACAGELGSDSADRESRAAHGSRPDAKRTGGGLPSLRMSRLLNPVLVDQPTRVATNNPEQHGEMNPDGPFGFTPRHQAVSPQLKPRREKPSPGRSRGSKL